MKKYFLFLFLILWTLGSPVASPAQSLIYRLPQTNLHVTATAKCDQFIAGPYAKYARKYLGMDAMTQNSVSYSLETVELQALLEADAKHIYRLNAQALRGADLSLLQLTSQGIILLSDAAEQAAAQWRFVPDKASLDDVGKVENLTTRQTVLYRQTLQDGEIREIPVQQSQVVEKPAEQRAEEAARKIFQARQARLNIATGNTDADYSGGAMKTALAELRRIEAEYLALFMGKHLYSRQVTSFDIIPRKEQQKQVYIAFRFSETMGLLTADKVEGRPVVIELASEDAPEDLSEAPASQAAAFHYRLPRIMKLRVLDGTEELLKTRVPVYQLGTMLTFPVIKK